MPEIIQFDQEINLPTVEHVVKLSRETLGRIIALNTFAVAKDGVSIITSNNIEFDQDGNINFPAARISIIWKWYRPFKLIIVF